MMGLRKTAAYTPDRLGPWTLELFISESECRKIAVEDSALIICSKSSQ